MHHCTHCIVYGTHMPGQVLHTRGLEGKTKGKSAENTNLAWLCPSKGSNVFTSVALNWLRNRDLPGCEKPKVWSVQIPAFSPLCLHTIGICWPDSPVCPRREPVRCVPIPNTPGPAHSSSLTSLQVCREFLEFGVL